MFKTLKNAFKIQDVETENLLCIYDAGGCEIRLTAAGTFLLILNRFRPGLPARPGDAFNFLDAFTGGSFENMSIFALNITPYITSSIIIQLLTIAIPKLEEMQRDGEDGRKKLAAITRYVTVGLALFESVAFTIGFHNQGWIAVEQIWKGMSIVASLTAGSAFLMRSESGSMRRELEMVFPSSF